MEISTKLNKVNINGNIKSISDFQNIKTSIDTLVAKEKSITINIMDSLSMTSTTIGYFNKLILKDKININMNIGNSKLIELLEDLSLDKLFHIKKA